MTKTITVDERRARLARRHLLLPEHRTDDVAAIADAVVALHSSDPVTVYLSAAACIARATSGVATHRVRRIAWWRTTARSS